MGPIEAHSFWANLPLTLSIQKFFASLGWLTFFQLFQHQKPTFSARHLDHPPRFPLEFTQHVENTISPGRCQRSGCGEKDR